MRKSAVLILCVICVSSIGVVSAVDTFLIPTISFQNIAPITSIVLPTIGSTVETSTITTTSDIIAPSDSTVTPQTQSALSAGGVQSQGVTVSLGTISSTSSTLTPQQGTQSTTAGGGGITKTNTTISPTISTLTAIIGTETVLNPTFSTFTISSSVSPSSSFPSPVTSTALKTSAALGTASNIIPTSSTTSVQSSTISPTSTLSGSNIVPTVSTAVVLLAGTASLTGPSSITPSSTTTISPSTSTPTPSTSTVTKGTATLGKTTYTLANISVSSFTSNNTLTRTTGSISGTSFTHGTSSSSISPSSPTVISPSTSTSSSSTASASRSTATLSKTSYSLSNTPNTPITVTSSTAATPLSKSGPTAATPTNVTLSRTTGSISGSVLLTSSSKSQYTLVGTQSIVGDDSSATSSTLTKTSGTIVGTSLGSGSNDGGILTKTTGSISGHSFDLSGNTAPTSLLTKTTTTLEGTQSGAVAKKTLSKATYDIKGCVEDTICIDRENVSISENILVYKSITGPEIVSAIFTDVDLESTISDGDTVTVTFDQNTNKPDVTNKSELQDVFTFSDSPAFQYSGVWRTPDTLIITLDNAQNSQLTLTGLATTISVNESGELKNSENTSLASTSTGTIEGEFNQRLGPEIISFVANDPIGNDSDISDGDTVTIKFAEPTDRGGFSGTLDVDDITGLFSFSGTSLFGSTIGTDSSGVWQSSSTLVITINDAFSNNLIIGTPDIDGTTVTVIGALKNAIGESLDSESISSELTGSFGVFSSSDIVVDGGSVSTALPAGTIAEIQLPEGDSGIITVSITDADLEGSSFLISPVGDIVEFDPTNGASCINGCVISFSFTSDEVPDEFTPFDLQIVHDANDDGDFDDVGEQLETTVVEITTGFYTATADSNFTSKFAVGGVKALALGGTFLFVPQISVDGGLVYVIKEDGFGGILNPPDLDELDDSFKLNLGDKLVLSFNLFEMGGIGTLENVSLYIDDTGIDNLRDSKTFIRYEPYKSDKIQVSDPNGKISSVTFDIEEINALNFVLKYEIKFSGLMNESDVLLHVWNTNNKDQEIFYSGVFEVSMPEESVQMDPEPIAEAVEIQTHIPDWVKLDAKKWSEGKIDDKTFANIIEFLISEKIIDIPMEANVSIDPEEKEKNKFAEVEEKVIKVPDWVKKNAEWWSKDMISNNQFIDSITYLIQKNIIMI